MLFLSATLSFVGIGTWQKFSQIEQKSEGLCNCCIQKTGNKKMDKEAWLYPYFTREMIQLELTLMRIQPFPIALHVDDSQMGKVLIETDSLLNITASNLKSHT